WLRQSRYREDHSDRAVQFVDCSVRLDAQAVLWNPGSVAQAGASLVARARVDFAQAIAHDRFTRVGGCDGRRPAMFLSRHAEERTQGVHRVSPSAELQAALDAAEQAASIARSLYQHNIEVRIKADKSPVTEADVRCEIAIREIIEARFPAHGFYGEETGGRDWKGESLWWVIPSTAPRHSCASTRCFQRKSR